MKSTTFRPREEVLAVTEQIYRRDVPFTLPNHIRRFREMARWAGGAGLHKIEFLLPQLQVKTEIQPYTFERRFAAGGDTTALKERVEQEGAWAVQYEWGPVSTLGVRGDEWTYHRYRASMFGNLLLDLCGDRAAQMSVHDVGCHNGFFALEFAELGFGRVAGTDLRAENIRQAKFLGREFGLPQVSFDILNARDISSLDRVDVMLCAGLFYHITFPMELLRNIFERTDDFLILDSLSHNEPFSAYHLVLHKDVSNGAEGETSYEFHPSYRVLIESLQAVGFGPVLEVVGDGAADTVLYRDGNVRTFVAFKPDSPTLRRIAPLIG